MSNSWYNVYLLGTCAMLNMKTNINNKPKHENFDLHFLFKNVLHVFYRLLLEPHVVSVVHVSLFTIYGSLILEFTC